MKKIYENHKGITLIALVITIIVLLILAGVAISAINGNENSMSKANQAKRETDIANAKEAAHLKATAYIQEYMDKKYVQNDQSVQSITHVGDYIAQEMNGGTEGEFTFTVSTRALTVKKTVTNETIVTGTIEDDGKITWDEEPGGNSGGDSSTWTGSVTTAEQTALAANGMAVIPDDQVPSNLKTSSVKAVLTGNVPVPTGYTYVEGTATTKSSAPNSWGVVIEDGSHNEWVWVPVNETESIAPSRMYEERGTSTGKTKEDKAEIKYAGKLNGVKLASVDGLNGINFGLKIADSGSGDSSSGSGDSSSASGSGEQNITPEPWKMECSDGNGGRTNITVEKRGRIILSGVSRSTPDDTSTYREPGLVDYDSNSDYCKQAGFTTAKQMAQAFVDDYNNMIESIETYGGFYVGRYEISGTKNANKDVTSASVKPNQDALANTNWYRFYKACRSLTSSSSSCQSTMMWGTQWDLMCLWTRKKGDKFVYSEFHSSAHTRSLAVKTGQNAKDKRNNIYDVEGSRSEWTQEAYGTYGRCLRGGNDYSGTAGGRAGGDNPLNEWQDQSSRPSLYIKCTNY